MGRRHFMPEQIIHMLRENARLKKLVAEQALDKSILEEVLQGKY